MIDRHYYVYCEKCNKVYDLVYGCCSMGRESEIICPSNVDHSVVEIEYRDYMIWKHDPHAFDKELTQEERVERLLNIPMAMPKRLHISGSIADQLVCVEHLKKGKVIKYDKQ